MCQLLVPCKNPGRLAARFYAFDGALHRREDFRMFGVADMPERRGEIARANEDTIYTLHAGNRLEIFEAKARLDLNQDNQPRGYAACADNTA